MAKINILVVDDLKSIRLTLEAILEDAGYSVAIAENGYEALEKIKRAHFDVVFMDIMMPRLGGVEAFREIKKLDPAAAVIMMSSYFAEESINSLIKEGAYTFLHKPFDMKKVIGLVEEIWIQKEKWKPQKQAFW